MESIYAELALYGSKNYYARTDNVFFPISEVCDDIRFPFIFTHKSYSTIIHIHFEFILDRKIKSSPNILYLDQLVVNLWIKGELLNYGWTFEVWVNF